jgi:hypothetical protein
MKKIVILFIVVVCFVVLFFLFIQRGGPNDRVVVLPTPTLVPTPYPSLYRGLVPGVSTEQNVIDLLGSPLTTKTGTNASTLEYSSKITGQPIRVDVTKTGTVYRVYEPVDTTVLYQNVTAGMGKPDLVLYGPLERSGFRFFVFLDNGVALLANPQTQEVKERLYFQPTNQDVFLRSIAPGMSLKSTQGQQ